MLMLMGIAKTCTNMGKKERKKERNEKVVREKREERIVS
jgi:hypothetical protein